MIIVFFVCVTDLKVAPQSTQGLPRKYWVIFWMHIPYRHFLCVKCPTFRSVNEEGDYTFKAVSECFPVDKGRWSNAGLIKEYSLV